MGRTVGSIPATAAKFCDTEGMMMTDEMTIRHRCFMDGIDWQHHLEADARGTPLFPSEESLRTEKTCLKGGCGVVEVEVRLIRWVEPQNLKFFKADGTHAEDPPAPTESAGQSEG